MTEDVKSAVLKLRPAWRSLVDGEITPRQEKILMCRLQGLTVAESAREAGCSVRVAKLENVALYRLFGVEGGNQHVKLAALLLEHEDIKQPVNVKLHPRKLELIKLVARGLSNREVAQAMGCSTGMVRQYMVFIFDRLGIWTRMELLHWYLGHDLEMNHAK